MYFKSLQTKQKSRGFSFGETLLAAFVLSVGLISVVKLFQVSATQSFFLRDAMIASGLAQEGIELVRNVRDNDFAAGGTGFASFSTSDKHCYIAVNSTNLNCYSSQSGTDNYSLIYSGGQYIATSSDAKFRRYIYIDYSASAPQGATVRSFVVWGDASLPPSSGSPTGCTIANQCVYTENSLTNWKS